ncbi:MAG: hypothetical protein GWN00_01180 [Aliifodinibius sp.]|nr:glycosyltransferase family 4 protein [Fodinibius sp.]NIV09944.1 hypothetical protein [Fodinibius sp.]NIY23474.1 hypothetical protein [Fodinibius sp.]
MKICLDPVYTGKPDRCASNIKMRKIVEYLLERRDDVYFYWFVPDWVTEKELGWYPKHCNIRYIKLPYSFNDRTVECLRIPKEYYSLVSFNGELWDIDVIVTNRASMVPMIKGMIHKPGPRDYWSRRVILIEDMPLMRFKDHAPMGHPESQELSTLIGYACSDLTAISAFWEKDIIIKESKKYLTPSLCRRIMRSMVESSPVLVDKVETKSKRVIQDFIDKKRPFNVGFVGRMVHGNNPTDIFKVMEHMWVYYGDLDIKYHISTQSAHVGRVKVPEFIHLRKLCREDFWEFVQTQMDVFIFMSVEEDYSMSLLEPLLLGTPAILIKRKWSVPTVGEYYPFFVRNVKEAYALVKNFYENYPRLYKKFVEWQQGPFQKLMKGRNDVYVPRVVEAQLDVYESDYEGNKQKFTKYRNDIVDALTKYSKESPDRSFVLREALRDIHNTEKFKATFAAKLQADADYVRRSFSVDWNNYRLRLKALGYRDVGVTPGHMGV